MGSISSYQSPFGNRYGSAGMAEVWSEATKRQMWREFWWLLLYQQTQDRLYKDPLEQAQLDIARAVLMERPYTREKLLDAQVYERQTRHDLVAELRSAQADLAVAGFERPELLHLGATSSDCEDYADEQQTLASLGLLKHWLQDLAWSLHLFATRNADTITLGRTHLRPAEATTLGYRFAVYVHYLAKLYQDLYGAVDEQEHGLSVGGACGTQHALYELTWLHGVESAVLEHYQGSGPRFQTQPRVEDLRLAGHLSTLAAWLHKLALDVRLMQSYGVLYEAKAEQQVGSSALPGKKNPISFERACSLARHVRALAGEVWDYSSQSMLERTLDDSAARRYCLPELFLSMDELLRTLKHAIDGLQVDGEASLDENWREGLTGRLSLLWTQVKSRGFDVTQEQLQAAVLRNGLLERDRVIEAYGERFIELPFVELEKRTRRLAEEAYQIVAGKGEDVKGKEGDENGES